MVEKNFSNFLKESVRKAPIWWTKRTKNARCLCRKPSPSTPRALSVDFHGQRHQQKQYGATASLTALIKTPRSFALLARTHSAEEEKEMAGVHMSKKDDDDGELCSDDMSVW